MGLGPRGRGLGRSTYPASVRVSSPPQWTALAAVPHLAAGATTVVLQVLGAHAGDVPRDGWGRAAEALL